MFFTPGPLIAALIVVPLTQGRAGLRHWARRLIRWRVAWPWYALAVAVPLAVQAATFGLTRSLAPDSPSSLSQLAPLSVVLTWLTASTLGWLATLTAHDHRLVFTESCDVGSDDRTARAFERSLLCRLDPLRQDQSVIGKIRKLTQDPSMVDRRGDAPTNLPLLDPLGVNLARQ